MTNYDRPLVNGSYSWVIDNNSLTSSSTSGYILGSVNGNGDIQWMPYPEPGVERPKKYRKSSLRKLLCGAQVSQEVS